MRTPIHQIGAGVATLRKDCDKYTIEQMRDVAEGIYVAYKNLVKYMENLLDFSALSSNMMNMNFAEKGFISIVQSSIKEFKELNWQDQKVQIDFWASSKSVVVKCDEEKIKKVIDSLLENALQYGKKSPIEILLHEGKLKNGIDALRISISDSGIGIPEKELVHIFGPFVESSATKNISGGKGIGLALCEKIISKHNGSIWAENNIDKPGATFSFIIPLTQ